MSIERKISVAIIVYGEANSGRDVLSEEKYKDLGSAFFNKGYAVEPS